MKRTFKDFFRKDLENVYFNEDEFGEKVMINGDEMVISYNTDSVNEKYADKRLASCDIVFYTKASNFEAIPRPDFLMEFQHDEYRIEVVHNHGGLLTIGLSRYIA